MGCFCGCRNATLYRTWLVKISAQSTTGCISYKYGWSEICVEDAEKHKLCTIYSEKCHQKCHIHVSLVVKCARHPTLMCHIRMVGQSSGTVPAELKFPYQIGWWRLPWKHKKWPYTGGQRIFRKDRLQSRKEKIPGPGHYTGTGDIAGDTSAVAVSSCKRRSRQGGLLNLIGAACPGFSEPTADDKEKKAQKKRVW